MRRKTKNVLKKEIMLSSGRNVDRMTVIYRFVPKEMNSSGDHFKHSFLVNISQNQNLRIILKTKMPIMSLSSSNDYQLIKQHKQNRHLSKGNIRDGSSSSFFFFWLMK